MRKTLCAACILLAFSVHAQSWNPVGSPGFSSGIAPTTAMAIDSKGIPYVVYQDGYNGRATVMKFDGTDWVAVGDPGFSLGAVGFTSIAINVYDTIYVAFVDVARGSKATVMRYTGSKWDTVGHPGFSKGAVQYTSIAATWGAPYIVFSEVDSNAGKVTVMGYNGHKWDTVGHPGFSEKEAQFTSIAIDGGGMPYVVYQDGVNGSATVMKYNSFGSAGWDTVGNVRFSAGRAAYTSIAIDPVGTPYVAYQDDGNGSKATVMRFDAHGWSPVGSAGISQSWAEYTSIAVDRYGTPYVAYSDHVDSNKATVMKYDYDSNKWQAVGKPCFSAWWASYTSMAIAPNGTPYLAYQDYENFYKATVMKFDNDVSVKKVNDITSSLAISPNPTTGTFTLHISSSQKEPATIIVTNMLGEKVKELTAITNEDKHIQLDSPQGVYFVTTVTKNGSASAKLVIE